MDFNCRLYIDVPSGILIVVLPRSNWGGGVGYLHVSWMLPLLQSLEPSSVVFLGRKNKSTRTKNWTLPKLRIIELWIGLHRVFRMFFAITKLPRTKSGLTHYAKHTLGQYIRKNHRCTCTFLSMRLKSPKLKSDVFVVGSTREVFKTQRRDGKAILFRFDQLSLGKSLLVVQVILPYH